MAVIKPFQGIRPADGLAERIAALPYDVYSREEARKEALSHPLSFLNIDRPEVHLPAIRICSPRKCTRKPMTCCGRWWKRENLSGIRLPATICMS